MAALEGLGGGAEYLGGGGGTELVVAMGGRVRVDRAFSTAVYPDLVGGSDCGGGGGGGGEESLVGEEWEGQEGEQEEEEEGENVKEVFFVGTEEGGVGRGGRGFIGLKVEISSPPTVLLRRCLPLPLVGLLCLSAPLLPCSRRAMV